MAKRKPITRQAAEYRKVREARLALEDKAKKMREKENSLKNALLERIADEEHDSVSAYGFIYSPTEMIWASVQDREAFIEWAKDNEPGMVKQVEDKSLLNQLVRERLDNGQELPPGIGFRVEERLSVRAKR